MVDERRHAFCTDAGSRQRFNDGTAAQISRTSGETWSSVLTPEANALWYVSEDSHGNYYTNEYSATIGGEETPARNVWKSTDGGTTWSKFWTAPSNARHLHLCAIDKYDNIYVSFGDFDGRATYRLDGQGNIIDTLSTNDGYTSFAEIDGIMYFGNDIVNARIWKYNPLTKNQLSVLDITSHFGAQFEENMLSAQSANGILYFAERGGERTPVNRSYAPNIFVSKDRGARWEMIDARINKSMNSEQNGIRAITLNPKRSKLFIEYSNYNYRYIDLG